MFYISFLDIAYVLVAAKAIIQGLAMVSRNLYGLRRVNRKKMADMTTSCCTTMPTVMAAMKRPSCANTSCTLAMDAMDTPIRLITPTGVVLHGEMID